MSLPTQSSDEERPVRLHISPLAPSLAADPADLVSRLCIFGAPLTEISIHRKPALDTSFAFITLSLTKQQYGALRRSLNGTKFKGAVLNIEEARAPDYRTRAELIISQNKEEMPYEDEERLFKRRALAVREQRLLQRLLYHVRRGHYQFGKRERGRLRATERDLRKTPPTFRVKIGNKSKVVRCKKQKLWGKARGGDVSDLSWEFVGYLSGEGNDVTMGHWENGKGNVIEIVKKQRLNADDFARMKVELQHEEFADSQIEDTEIEVVPSNPESSVKEETEEDRLQRIEKEKSLKILQDMFGEVRPETETAPPLSQAQFDFSEEDDDDTIFNIIQSGTSKTVPTNVLDNASAIDDGSAGESMITVTNTSSVVGSVSGDIDDDAESSNSMAATDEMSSQKRWEASGAHSDQGQNTDSDSSAAITSDESEEEQYGDKQNTDSDSSSAITSDESEEEQYGDKSHDSDISSDENEPSSSDSDSDGIVSSSGPDSELDHTAAETAKRSVASTKGLEKGPSRRPMKNVVTERLRSLFNNDGSKSSFSLFQSSDLSDFDIEEDDSEGGDSNNVGQSMRSPSPLTESNIEELDEENAIPPEGRGHPDAKYLKRTTRSFENLPLLFPHPDSAFLNAQTQFSRAPTRPPLSRGEWEKEFYEKRGEWMRKAKRRRRDVIRRIRRKEGNNLADAESGRSRGSTL
ncbi:hypothetical protein V1517DRAFT_311808 [Lipomyces orientalis]|uniref:Uncharacterized protein n=1 Tax=Lipomyces orientalis TaxID=1233043 RepID=A0ACC3TZH9_9ASCO